MMRMKMGIFCAIFALSAWVLYAGTGWALSVSTIASSAGYCKTTYVRGSFEYQYDTDDGDGSDWAALTLTDGAGMALNVTTVSTGPGGVGIGFHFPVGEASGAIQDITVPVVTLRLWDTGIFPSGITLQERHDLATTGVLVSEITIDLTAEIPACANVAAEPSSFDIARPQTINGAVGMADVAVFDSNVVADAAAYDVYEIVGVNGEYAFTITQEMLAPFAATLTDARIHVSDSGLIEVWALSDGRYLLRIMDGIGGVTDLFFYDLGGAMDGYSYNIYAPTGG